MCSKDVSSTFLGFVLMCTTVSTELLICEATQVKH